MILLLFIFFTPAGNPPHLSSSDERHRLQEFVRTRRNETERLKNSTWLHPPENITGILPYPVQREDANRIYKQSFLPPEIIDAAIDIWYAEMRTTASTENQDSVTVLKKRDTIEFDPEYLAKSDIEKDQEFAFFSNISGVFEGTWTHENKTRGHLIPRNMTIPEAYMPPSTVFIYGRNISMVDEREKLNSFDNDPGYKRGSQGNISEPEAGKVSLTIDEIPSKYGNAANVTIVTVSMTIFDRDENSKFNLDLDGFHFKHTGNLIMSTSSLKYSGLQYLPHLILDETYFEEARDLMYRYLNITITSYEDDMNFAIFQDADVRSENCEYVVYAHFDSVPFSQKELREIEEETQNPTGKPIPRFPRLKMSPLIYSPDCAIALKSIDVDGEKLEQYWYRIRIVILVGVALLLSQVILFARQMRDTSTPSLMLKVNFLTIIMMAIMDGSIWMASFVSFFVDTLALPFMSMSFLSFVLTSLYELRYMTDIYQIQQVEASAQVLVQSNRDNTLFAMPDGSIVNSQNRTAENGGNESSLPLPVTTNTPPVVNLPSENSDRNAASMLYSRFYFIFLVFIITSLLSTTWPRKYRLFYEYVIMLLFYSIWYPQIYRNITKGFRNSFLWSFILGTSVIRLLPLYYVCLHRRNVFDHHYDPMMAAVITAWTGIQLLVLFLQKIIGPRFFLPRGYLPALYDYHPILYRGDAESELGIDVLASSQTNPSQLLSSSGSTAITIQTSSDKEPLLNAVLRPKVDCAICMMPIELVLFNKLDVDGHNDHFDATNSVMNAPSAILARRKYMVTPCQHVFHTECLETWMRTRLQCPICRNPLPPL